MCPLCISSHGPDGGRRNFDWRGKYVLCAVRSYRKETKNTTT